MIQSTELKNLILQLYEGLSNGKPLDIVQDIFSKEEGFIAIGSGPDEWWHDSDVIKHGYQLRVEAGGSDVMVTDIEAYQEGTVGWVVDRVILKTPDGDQIPIRHTYVFHQEGRKWKIIHANYSLDVINEKF